MKKLSNIQLYPVIDLSPTYLGDDYNYPTNMRDIEERYQYWKSILAKFNLDKLEPIEKEYEYVKTSDIDELSLEALVKKFMEDYYRTTIAEVNGCIEKSFLRSCLEGGVVLSSDDKIIIIPQCCVCFQDYREWLKISKSESFQKIYIGHPWIYFKTAGDNILLTRLITDFSDGKWKYYYLTEDETLTSYCHYFEKDGEIIEDTDVQFSIDYQEMEAALAALEKEIATFKNRIHQTCIKLGLNKPAEIADTLINGEKEDEDDEDYDDEEEDTEASNYCTFR